MHGKITKTSAENFEGVTLFDTEVKGFYARRLPSGAVSYGYRYRVNRARRELALGVHGNITAEQARTKAEQMQGKVAGDGELGGAEKQAKRWAIKRDETETVNAILDEFAKRHVDNLRSSAEIKSAFDRLVRPKIGTALIYDLKRGDIIKLLDGIADKQGEVMADRTLAFVRKAFNWQMVRDEDFRSPIIKGMMRTNPKERAGDRILSDEEIVEVLTAVRQLDGEAPACFAPFVRALFYTAQRRCDVSDWHENEFDGDDWTIPAERFKTKKKRLVPLTRSAREQIEGATGFLISSERQDTFQRISKAKSALDLKIAELRKGRRKPMPDWTFHDIRRTCRSLMSRYTSPDHAERVIGGVRGTYDHHQYKDEKLGALKKLELHINWLMRPKSNKVVALRA